MRRMLAAPRAWRTAISWPRALARASSRLATLTQLISRTRPTAPESRMSDWRTLPTRVSARAVRWIVQAAWAGKSVRRPQFGTALLAGLALVAKAGGHDADNLKEIVVKTQTLAENVRVGAKCALPEPIADDDLKVGAGCGVVRIEGAAQRCIHAEHREVAR